jgi:hypothetical protein
VIQFEIAWRKDRNVVIKGILEYISEQLSLLGDISYRAMMRKYILYYRGEANGRAS